MMKDMLSRTQKTQMLYLLSALKEVLLDVSLLELLLPAQKWNKPYLQDSNESDLKSSGTHAMAYFVGTSG